MEVIVPALYPVDTLDQAGSDTAFQISLGKLLDWSIKTENLLKHLQAKKEELIKQLEETPQDQNVTRGKFLEAIGSLTPYVISLTSLNSSSTKLQEMLSAADPKTGLTVAAAMMQGERLVAKLKLNNNYVIRINVQSKGSNKITENLWRNTSIEHSAGTELSCLIFGKDGEVIYSFQHLTYQPYIKADKITGDAIKG